MNFFYTAGKHNILNKSYKMDACKTFFNFQFYIFNFPEENYNSLLKTVND